MIDAHAALRACEALVGLAIALQAIELLQVRRALRDDRALGWRLVRDTYATAPRVVRSALDGLLAERPFVALLALQLGASVALASGVIPSVVAPALMLMSLLVSARFRGPYNGGSDVMTMVVLLGVSIAHLLGEARGRAIGLGWIAAQLVLSYFVAGVVKLKRAPWRDGRALHRVVTSGSYEVPAHAARLVATPSVARVASWAVIALECGFPLALLDRRACVALLAAGALFHASNAFLLGLNRFFWAWLAAYPALYYWAALRG